MSGAVLVCSLLLAAVFAVAGMAKFSDRGGSRDAARGFGVPDSLAGAVGVGVPVAELAVAGLLLFPETRVVAGGMALLLLSAFSVAIGVAMARGRAPDCHCFGQLHSEPAGWRALVRNAVVAAVAAFVLVAGRSDSGVGALVWADRLDGLEWATLALALALVAVIAVGGLVVLHVTRSYGRVLTRLDRAEERLQAAGLDLSEPDEMPQLGLVPGTAAPPFSLRSVGGEQVALEDLMSAGRPLLLVFTSPTCGQCSVLMPKVAEWQRGHADDMTVALLSGGNPSLVREETEGLDRVLLDKDLSVYEAYDVNGTPSAVLVSDDGTIAAWTAAGAEWIEALFEQALAGLGRTPGFPVGAEVPSEIAELVSGPTALLFWNPDCGFCQSMEESLRVWIADPPAGAPALLVVSSGDFAVEAPVIPDPQWELASSLGADGTPMAVLVDGEGRIASGVAGGAPDVLELLRARELAVTD
jgi:thiol-disulfide isomerase/thioredoxin